MRSDILRGTAIAVALFGSLGIAVAQQPPSAKSADPQGQAEKAISTVPGKNGKEEPGSHAPSSKPEDIAVFINGALAVPGAPKEGDTIPAKFSAKNAADDKLIIIAYTFKNLTDEQRNAIFGALKADPAKSALKADVGTALPLSADLQTVPDDLVAKIPQTGGYQYAVADNRVLLVSPANRIVVAVISEDPNGTTGAAGRKP